MSKQAFDRKIEALEALRGGAKSEATVAQVRKALQDRNNYLVSKAATLTADLSLPELIPDLLSAFDRHLTDPVKSDPQCWAKNAIAKALKDLGHRDAAVFLRGLVHIQLEPVWGGQADSAATLRGTCALALVDCELDDLAALGYLLGGLADAEKPVRVDAAMAIGQLGRAEGALLLRLKALLGDPEPEVTGQCFTSLLALDAGESVAFVARFLKTKDEEVCVEAASALAQSRESAALDVLKEFWKTRLTFEMRRTLLMALGASPLRDACEFLLGVVKSESNDIAGEAVAALAVSRFHGEMRERVGAAIESRGDAVLRRVFTEVWRLKTE